jgi:glycosyltransferase involved in cell wall biosynthesis
MPFGKILLISHGAGVGGATRSIGFLAAHLPGSLLLVPDDGPILDLYRQVGIRHRIQRIPSLFYSTYQKVSPFIIARFIKDLPKIASLEPLVRQGYTTFHFNEIVFAPTVWLARLLFGRRIRIVTHARVTMPVHRLGWSRALFLRWLRASDAIIGIDEVMLEPFRKFPHAVQITNPVDLGNYIPHGKKTAILHERFHIPSDEPIAGLFAQMHKGKGQDFILSCLAKQPLPQFRLVLFGTGPLEKSLREYVKTQGLENRVVFAGHTNALFEAMEGCDFIIRAEDFGYLGRDILEANALGVPILTALAPDCNYDELFKDGYNGFAFLPQNHGSLTEAIGKMLEACATIRGRTVRDRRGFNTAEEYAQRVSRVYADIWGEPWRGGPSASIPGAAT